MKSSDVELQQLNQLKEKLNPKNFSKLSPPELLEHTTQELDELFRQAATDINHQDTQTKAEKGDPLAIACIGAALYQKGNKELAFEYFEIATQRLKDQGDGKLEHVIATLVEEPLKKNLYYRRAMNKGHVKESGDALSNANSFKFYHYWHNEKSHSMGQFHVLFAIHSLPKDKFDLPINQRYLAERIGIFNKYAIDLELEHSLSYLSEWRPEKFKDLFIQYPLSGLKNAVKWHLISPLGAAKKYFDKFQRELIDEIIVARMSGESTSLEKYKEQGYDESYFEDIENKIEARIAEINDDIEKTSGPKEIKNFEQLAKEKINSLLGELQKLLGKDAELLLSADLNSPNALDNLLKAGEESLTSKDKYSSPLAKKIADNYDMQIIFLQIRAFKKVLDACPTATSSSSDATKKDNTKHLLKILTAIDDADKELNAATTRNIPKEKSTRPMHWLQYLATYTAIGIPFAALHSYIKHGTGWYAYHHEKHAARKEYAANKARTLFTEGTKVDVLRAKQLPTVQAEIRRPKKSSQ